MRIGIGYDVHKLADERDLIIGGVKIEYYRGLEGHSDADVLVHSIMDALLGAAGLRDIGFYFPPDDCKFKDANSLELLCEVKEMIYERGFSIINIDSVIIAQEPKMKNYIPNMKDSISRSLGIDKERINVKATTTEKLGYLGRGEGIAAQAVVLLEVKNEY